MPLERIHLDILRYLYDNLPEDLGDLGKVSRKILFKSVNHKQKQIEKACKELQEKGYVEFQLGFYISEWPAISITDEGLDYLELNGAERGI